MSKDTYAIVKQYYMAQEPNFTIYKIEYKWFGLKMKFKPFLLNDDIFYTSTFKDINELLGRLIKHYCDKERKICKKIDKKKIIENCKNNVFLKLYVSSYHCNEEPEYIGKFQLKQMFMFKK